MIRLLLILALLLGAAPAFGHALGVSRATLTETGDGAYVIDIGRQLDQARRMGVLDPLLPDRCTLEAPGAGTRYRIACAPALTADDAIVLPWVTQQGVMLTARWRDGAEARDLFVAENGAITVELGRLRHDRGSWVAAAGRYFVLGVEHILAGVDHLLFVLGLLLLVRGVGKLIATITAFTIAHSITLSFATLGLVPVAGRPVEAAIALSIVYLALEILRAERGETALALRWPWTVAFVFGLLHGFGFAGALSELGLPEADIPLALLFFNIGVEAGQLLFVAAVLIVLWGARRLPLACATWPRTATAYAIGGIAAYWVFSRGVPIVAGALT